MTINILVEAYSKQKYLCDKNSPFYHNKKERQRALENAYEVGQLKDILVKTFKNIVFVSKMKSLNTKFRRRTYGNKMNNSTTVDKLQPLKLMLQKRFVSISAIF